MKANRIFYTILILLVVISVVATFLRIVVNKEYQVVAETQCDPLTEKCFVRDGDSYYKLISKKAAHIAACEASERKMGCEGELSCVSGETACSYTYCSEDIVQEGEVCSENL